MSKYRVNDDVSAVWFQVREYLPYEDGDGRYVDLPGFDDTVAYAIAHGALTPVDEVIPKPQPVPEPEPLDEAAAKPKRGRKAKSGKDA